MTGYCIKGFIIKYLEDLADKLTHSTFLSNFAFKTRLNGIIYNGHQGT
jgi:hypothetical protein